MSQSAANYQPIGQFQLQDPVGTQGSADLSAPPTRIPVPPVSAGLGEPLPGATPKRKRTRVTAKIYTDIGNCSINGHPVEAAIRDTGVSKYTALKICKEHQNMNVVVPKAFPPPKGKTSKKEAAYPIMCAILHRHPNISLAQLGRHLANHGIYVKERTAQTWMNGIIVAIWLRNNRPPLIQFVTDQPHTPPISSNLSKKTAEPRGLTSFISPTTR